MKKSLSAGECDQEGNWITEIKFSRRSNSQPTSLQSEGLEWDHSADLGVLGSSSSEERAKFKKDLSSTDSNSNKTSTPSRSPAVLKSLQYSPVLSSSSMSILDGGKDNWRKSPLGSWQTEGITKSEIEYEKRKASGYSSSSVTDLSRKLTTCSYTNSATTSSSSKSTSDSDVPTEVVLRLFQKKFPGCLVNREISRTSTASIDCDAILSLMDKEYLPMSAKYDLIKTVRGHQVGKVWNEIADLEKLNKDLIDYVKKKNIRAPVTSKGLHQKLPKSSEQKVQTHQNPSDDIPPQKYKTFSEPGSRASNKTYKIPPCAVPLQKSSTSSSLEETESDKPQTRPVPKSSVAVGTDSPPLTRKQRETLIREIVRECFRGNMSQTSDASQSSDQVKEKTDKKKSKKEKLPERRPPVGFFVFMDSTDDASSCENVKPVQEYLRENNPKCYNNIKKRDDVLVTIKRDREAHNEALIQQALKAGLSPEQMMDYLRQIQCHRDDKQRFQTFWTAYVDSDKENVKNGFVISSKEMKERTRRLQRQDSVSVNRMKKDEEERRKKISRQLQRNFSKNLRKYQKVAGVNIPDRLKLGPRQL